MNHCYDHWATAGTLGWVQGSPAPSSQTKFMWTFEWAGLKFYIWNQSVNLHRLAFHSQPFWCQPSSSKTSFAERNHRGLENPKQKGATRREQERVDTVKGVFSRSFRELTAVFHWLSGFTSKGRSGWRSLHLAAACVRCLLQFTSHFAYIIWFSPHNSQRRGDRWYHPLFTDAETDSEADLSRAIRRSCTPTQVFWLCSPTHLPYRPHRWGHRGKQGSLWPIFVKGRLK